MRAKRMASLSALEGRRLSPSYSGRAQSRRRLFGKAPAFSVLSLYEFGVCTWSRLVSDLYYTFQCRSISEIIEIPRAMLSAALLRLPDAWLLATGLLMPNWRSPIWRFAADRA